MSPSTAQPPQLPTDFEEAVGRIGSVLIYAAAKIGKSTQAVKMFPDALVLDTENGYGAIRAKRHPVASWQDFLSVGWALQEGQAANYPAVIIDTGDRLAAMCADYTIRKLAGGAAQNQGRAAQRNFVHASDFEWGKGYAAIAEEFALRVGKIMAIMPNVVIVCHADTMKVTDSMGREQTVMVPDLAPKGIRRFLEDTVSHIFYARVEQTEEGQQAVFRTHNGADWRAGGRLPEGAEPLPDPMPFDGGQLRRELEARLSPPKAEKPKQARKPARSREGAQEPQEQPPAGDSEGAADAAGQQQLGAAA